VRSALKHDRLKLLVVTPRDGSAEMETSRRFFRDSAVGILTGDGLDGLEIEFWRGEIFRTRPDRPCGSTHYRYRVSFAGVKRSGRGFDHPLAFRAEVKERLELYLYSPFWTFMADSRVTLPTRVLRNQIKIVVRII
jgi:hypothetical protein